MSAPGTITWFAQHELRLAWRDWLAMMTAGKRGRERAVAIAVIVFALCMHLLAFSMVGRYAEAGAIPDKTTLVVVTGSALLFWSLMLSQALESVTRMFYSRADLDLILSSPAAARRLFTVRIGAMAFTVVAMALLLAAPFINVLVFFGGARWLAAYGVVVGMGAAAAALAVALAVALFKIIGPKRTRLVAQIIAAVIGAAFVIGLQVAAIMSYGTLSRVAFLQSDVLVALAPDAESLLWWPARAILGDIPALLAVLGTSVVLLAATTAILSAGFGEHAVAASGISSAVTRQRHKSGFRHMSPRAALRRKEWALLRRDPWLMSQTLMQILYLLPPALLLWRSFGDGAGALVLLPPVLVMAAGQLAGGLAWLAISGEDAPDLVATAPVVPSLILRAKIEAVMGAIVLVFAPLVVALWFIAPVHAAVASAGIVIAALSAIAIQLWFRAQAKRSHFRRRHTSSRIATFAEAFSSVTWAATAGLAAAGTWFAAVTAVIAIGILFGTRLMSPNKA